MDTKQLTTFITLAKTLNYQKAAEQLQYAPSTLFKHIQLLEQELGVSLFCKQGKRLCMTQEGETFVAHAENIMESYRAAVESISACNVQESTMMIGGCEINTGNSLLRLLNRFNQTYPHARMSLLTGPNASVPQLVKSELIDLGFYYCIDPKPLPGLESVCLYQEPVYLLTGKNNPILQKKTIEYADLQGMPFVYPHDTCCFVAEFLGLMRRKGVTLSKITYLGNLHLVVEQAHEEHALTLMPHRAVESFCQKHDVAPLPLGEPQIWGWETLVYKNYDAMSPMAKALVRQAKEYAQTTLAQDDMLHSPN